MCLLPKQIKGNLRSRKNGNFSLHFNLKHENDFGLKKKMDGPRRAPGYNKNIKVIQTEIYF